MIKSLQDLQEIRDRLHDDIMLRKEDHAPKRIMVCMGESGLRARARAVLAAFVEEVHKRGLTDVMVTQCGGRDSAEEPIVVVETPQETTEYIRVTPEAAVRIVEEHILGGKAADVPASRQNG